MKKKEEHHQDSSDYNNNNNNNKEKKKINVPFFSSIWFHFPPRGPSPQGKAGKSGTRRGGEWERAGERNDSHPREQRTPDKYGHSLDTVAEPI